MRAAALFLFFIKADDQGGRAGSFVIDILDVAKAQTTDDELDVSHR